MRTSEIVSVDEDSLVWTSLSSGDLWSNEYDSIVDNIHLTLVQKYVIARFDTNCWFRDYGYYMCGMLDHW
jgi:hypothetical protein